MGVAVAQGMSVVVVGAVLGGGLAGRWGLAVGGLVSLLPAASLTLGIARCRPYPDSTRGLVAAAVDSTWGALTTWASAFFLLALAARGNRADPGRSLGSGLLHLCDPAISGYATTIGIVTAGCSARVEAHERVHVLQSRLFGPLYLPLVGIGFVVATVLPYWLVSPSARRRVRGVRAFFVRGVYPHTWHEWWAYRVAPTSRHVTT